MHKKLRNMRLKTTLLLLLNLFFINAFSQDSAYEEYTHFLANPKLSIADFEKFRTQYRDKGTDIEGQIVIENIYRRTLSGEYEQHLYSFSRNLGKRKYDYYALNIISIDNQIIFSELKKLNQDTVSIQHKCQQYRDLIQNMHSNTNFKPDTTHLYFNPPHLIFVGFNCKVDGEYDVENEADSLKKLVYSKNKTEIIKWCLSLSPEIRCYGAIGLYHLQKNGVLLNDKERALLRKISKEQTSVYGCGGCVEGGYLYSVRGMYEQGKKDFDDELAVPRA